MSENVKKTVEFLKKLFCAHLEEKKYEESYKYNYSYVLIDNSLDKTLNNS